MNFALEFLILVILLVLAAGQFFLFLLAGPVLKRQFIHAQDLQRRLEEKAKEQIPAGIFKPVKVGDDSIALMPIDEGTAEGSAVNEVVDEWRQKMGLA